MTTQPEALRLAERLERRRLTRWVHATGETPRASGYVVDQDCAEAAAELRRLHAENAELLEALRSIVNLWDYHASAHHDGIIYPLHQAARAAIAKAEGEKT
jgi:hypothetical protein